MGGGGGGGGKRMRGTTGGKEKPLKVQSCLFSGFALQKL